jgi:tetratricopeptide (TPR) repeat protein
MTAKAGRLSKLLLVAAFTAATAVCASAGAQDSEASTHEAGKHFQRGVGLYGEADYRSALVEFKRAYALSPNVAVLYNVGETEFQLQEYASALTTFRHYLAEAAPSEPHRNEVENNVEVLRSRVGHISVTTVPTGAEITIDDQPAGKTPLEESVLVSIGHRKIVAAMAGHQPVTRYVDVAADDNASVTLPLGAVEGVTMQVAASKEVSAPSKSGPTLRIVGWVSAVALAGGAVGFGLLAEKAGNDLKDARESYPTSSATLTHDASVTTTYSVLADSLAAAALVVGGITLYSTLSASSSPSSAPIRGSTGGTRVMLGPGSARVEVKF